VAIGWAELLQEVQERRPVTNPALEAVWKDFRKLVASSPRKEMVGFLERLAKLMPLDARFSLALLLSRVLAPIEWPVTWEPLRAPLVQALTALIKESNPAKPETFAGLLGLRQDAELQAVAFVTLQNARNLLRDDCNRSALPSVARLCNVGQSTCLRVYRRALKTRTEQPEPLIQARSRYMAALQQYAEAAQALNLAIGDKPLFEGLAVSLDGA
jgi:hypothetical protein